VHIAAIGGLFYSDQLTSIINSLWALIGLLELTEKGSALLVVQEEWQPWPS
jgi:hypothetical protein